LELAALVTDGIQRSRHVGREPIRLVDDHGDLLFAPVRVGRLAEQLAELELLEEDELELSKIGLVTIDGLRHRACPPRKIASVRQSILARTAATRTG